MNRHPTRRQAWADGLLLIVFGALLWLPTVEYFGHMDWTSPLTENRLLAPCPRLTRLDVSGVRDYLAATENYFNDHFGFRRRLIRWCQQWKARLFRDGRRLDYVIAGQAGWLFYSKAQMIEHYLGLKQFTPGQLQSWQRLLEKRRDWLAARGIQYLFVVPPDKHSVYSEYLPAWLLAARPAGRQTKLDQLVQYLKAHSTVEILDLREPLIAGKKVAPTYLQNDTHWNQYGGFIGSQEVIKALSRQRPGLPPLRLEDFDWSHAPATGGDLANMQGTPEKPENNSLVFTPKPPLVVPRLRPLPNLLPRANPNEATNANYVIENPNLPAPAVDVVVFHDSFGRVFRQFLGYRFHRIIFVGENKEFNAGIVTEYQPQIVINEMVERLLDTEDPDPILAREALP